MKKLLVFTLVSVLAVSFVSAQTSKAVREFHDKYENDRDASVVQLNGELFKLMGAFAAEVEGDDDAEAIARISEGIESMQILSVPYYKSGIDPSEIDNLRGKLKKENYEELMQVRDGRDRIYFLTQGSKNEVKDMVVLVREEENLVVMNMNGTLNMKDLAYVAKKARKMN